MESLAEDQFCVSGLQRDAKPVRRSDLPRIWARLAMGMRFMERMIDQTELYVKHWCVIFKRWRLR